MIKKINQQLAAVDPTPLSIANKTFQSRIFIGTGKFSSIKLMGQVIEASGSEMVTVALRRIDLNQSVDEQQIISVINRDKVMLLPNTSGAKSADEAIRLARMARSIGAGNWIKLEVTPDPVYLFPDPLETIRAAETLVKDGFVVLPYINADPILALRLQEIGCAAVMPLGSPIGTGQGIRTRESIHIIIEQAHVPVVVDAGLGAPSHASEAMEMGADAVLVNTALAVSKNPIKSAFAFALGVAAGREAFLYGMHASSEIDLWKKASASSPLTGFLENEINKDYSKH